MSVAALVLSSAQPKEMGRPIRLAPIIFSGSPARAGRGPALVPPGFGKKLPRRRAELVEIPARNVSRQRQHVTPAVVIAGVALGGAVLGYIVVVLVLMVTLLRSFLPVSG